nr:DUF3021 domain-containing protein [Bittarella massiliensis (ex Durand et al. 2017)]
MWPASKSGWACEREEGLSVNCAKKAAGRAVVGFGWGVCISTAICYFISLGVGEYWPVTPELLAAFGGDLLAAVGLQLLTSGLLGAVCAAISVFFEIERWSLARQTALHGCCCAAAVIGTAALNRWVTLSAAGLASYLLLFLGIYLVIWLALAHHWRQKLRAINQKLKGL